MEDLTRQAGGKRGGRVGGVGGRLDDCECRGSETNNPNLFSSIGDAPKRAKLFVAPTRLSDRLEITGVLCDHGRVLAAIPWRFFMTSLTRRVFLQTSTAAAGAALFGSADAEERPKPTKKLAVVTTAYHYLSHAYHICGRFLYGYLRDGKMHYPDFAIAGMYVEQKKEGDLSVELSRKHGFTLYPDVAGALTLGGDKLAVDGVLLIGEHGDYPYNDKGQKLYPRYELFQKIVEVFRKSEKSVPVFNDKHLYYDRKKAAEMVETARKIGFPLMAGSSLPVTWRRPELELPLGVDIKDALVVSRGEIEIYGIHALEALQCMVERRKTTKQGVKAVTCLEGEAVWKAGDDGVWSKELLEAALSRSPSRNVGDPRKTASTTRRRRVARASQRTRWRLWSSIRTA